MIHSCLKTFLFKFFLNMTCDSQDLWMSLLVNLNLSNSLRCLDTIHNGHTEVHEDNLVGETQVDTLLIPGEGLFTNDAEVNMVVDVNTIHWKHCFIRRNTKFFIIYNHNSLIFPQLAFIKLLFEIQYIF